MASVVVASVIVASVKEASVVVASMEEASGQCASLLFIIGMIPQVCKDGMFCHV